MKIVFLFSLIVLAGCANILPLSGGDKDLAPPTLLSVSPKNSSVLFNSNTIIFEFDEAISIDPSLNLLISPALNTNINSKVNKNKLILTLEETLKENTTYSISLNNYIKDVNEGNVLEKLNYKFSTGTKLDTLYIRGQVLDAISKQKESNILLKLFSANSEDSLLFNTQADYLSKSNSNGTFEFSALPSNNYYLFAIEDLDNNYRFSIPNERVGFISKLVSPSVDSLNVFIFDETKKVDSVFVMKQDSSITGFGKLIINNVPENSITQVLLNDTIIFSSNQASSSMDSLVPGLYTLRLIDDHNENGQWDTGNLKLRQQAENIEYYTKEVNVRADWDIIIDWESK